MRWVLRGGEELAHEDMGDPGWGWLWSQSTLAGPMLSAWRTREGKGGAGVVGGRKAEVHSLCAHYPDVGLGGQEGILPGSWGMVSYHTHPPCGMLLATTSCAGRPRSMSTGRL